jgi:CBS domain-containing protein
MSSPVATVPPDEHLKDVAAILVEHGINAAPLVDDGNRLLGIVSGADLLRLEAESAPGQAGRHLRPVWADAWSPGNRLQSVGEVHRVNSRRHCCI